jgi:hypothetical protein
LYVNVAVVELFGLVVLPWANTVEEATLVGETMTVMPLVVSPEDMFRVTGLWVMDMTLVPALGASWDMGQA